MTLISPALESIDSFLLTLTKQVGDKEQLDFFKSVFVPGIKDPDKFLRPFNSWSEAAHEGWDKWKVRNVLQTDKICEYEEKLKKCDAYLTLMKNLLKQDNSSEKIIIRDLREEEVMRQASKKNEKSSLPPSTSETVMARDADEQLKMSQIKALLTRKDLIEKSEVVFDDVNKAFEIVKTLTFSRSVIEDILIDIFQTFLGPNSLRFCKKAYEVACFKQYHSPENTYLLDQIIEKCMLLGTKDAETFLAEILKYYPKYEVTISYETPLIRPPLSKGVDKRNPIRDALIRKGDEDVIKSCEADHLADQRKFKEALSLTQTIPDTNLRRGSLASLLGKCCEFGDEEALRFAIELGLQHEDSQYGLSYLYDIIDACKKNKLRDLALEAASHIKDSRLRGKSIEKINRAQEFRKI